MIIRLVIKAIPSYIGSRNSPQQYGQLIFNTPTKVIQMKKYDFFFLQIVLSNLISIWKKMKLKIDFRPNLKRQICKNSRENPMIKSLCHCRRHKNTDHKGKKRRNLTLPN